MKKLLFLLVMFFLALSACEKKPKPAYGDDVPTCIEEKIDEFKMSADPCNQSGPSVIEYRFQGELVYAFDMGQCISDGSSTIYDAECVEICILGTIVGITDCKDEPFDNAIEVRVLWQQ